MNVSSEYTMAFYIKKMSNGLEFPCTTTDYHDILGIYREPYSYRTRRFIEDNNLYYQYAWIGKGGESEFIAFDNHEAAEKFCSEHNIDLLHTMWEFGENVNYQIVEK